MAVGHENQPAPSSEIERVPNSKLGLSLSLCVADIIAGNTDIEEVAGIVANTRAGTPLDMTKVIGEYQDRYWQANPKGGAEIAWRLLSSGRVWQPRLEEIGGLEDTEGHSVSGGIWLDVAEATPAQLREITGITPPQGFAGNPIN